MGKRRGPSDLYDDHPVFRQQSSFGRYDSRMDFEPSHFSRTLTRNTTMRDVENEGAMGAYLAKRVAKEAFTKSYNDAVGFRTQPSNRLDQLRHQPSQREGL